MADKSYTPLSSFTLAEVRSLCSIDPVFNKLSEAQQNSAINQATHELSALLNKEGKDSYRFDSIGDADLVLAPTASANDAQFDIYLHLKLTEDIGAGGGGGSMSYVVGTKVGSLIYASLAVDSYAGDYVVYTVTLSGDVLDDDMLIDPSNPTKFSIHDRTTSTTFKITARKLHSLGSIFIKKRKEA